MIHTAVVGAGACGLGLARGLWRNGASVTVHERAGAMVSNGHGFLLLANGCEALRRLGCGPAESLGHPIRSARILCTTGEVLAEYPLEGTVAILRHTLLEALMSGAPDDLVQFGHSFERFEWEGETARTVRFRNGDSHAADAFIAADGVRSGCRLSMGLGAMTTPGRVREIVAQARHPMLAAELGHRFLKFVDPAGGLAVGLVPLGGDRLIWFIQFDSQRFDTPAANDMAAFVAEHFRSFPLMVRQALASADPEQMHLWRTVDEEPARRWSVGNVALAGDAAHPLLPFTSQGVNTALEDAVLLSDLLSRCDDPGELPALFGAYEQQRRPTLLSCVASGRQLARSFVQPAQSRLPLALLA